MLKWISRILWNLGAALLLFLMLLTTADVIGRNLLARPVAAATELTEVALVTLCFLTFPLAALRGQHIVADLLDNVPGGWIRAVQRTVPPVLTTIFFGILSWRMWILAGRAGSYGDITPILGVPLQPVLQLVAFLCAVTAVATVYVAFRRADKEHGR